MSEQGGGGGRRRRRTTGRARTKWEEEGDIYIKQRQRWNAKVQGETAVKCNSAFSEKNFAKFYDFYFFKPL